MEKGFWAHLPRPIIGLSPMDGVTDHPFRHVQKKYGNPDVVFTEFTSAEGVSRNALRLFQDFLYDETQRPIVAQIFGNEPRAFYVTAVILGYLGFDGIDINMGCPAKNVAQHGSGAALIRTPKLAQEIIRATQQGVQDWANGITLDELPELKEKTKQEVLSRHAALPEQYQQRKLLPVSVKTRIGFDVPCVEEWIPVLLEMEPAVISLHGRTLKQLYSGEAQWDHIATAAKLVHQTDTIILGNGDVQTVQDFHQKVTESQVDGVLIGRATQGNPWFFADLRLYQNEVIEGKAPTFHHTQPTAAQQAQIAIEHAQLFEQTFPEHGFLPMRKHMGWYINSFPYAAQYRTQAVLANSAAEVKTVLESFSDLEKIS